MTLEILICTIDDGIGRVGQMFLEKSTGIGYVVSWQQTEKCSIMEIPEDLRRDDVKIVTLQGKGLSRNRNNAIQAATADICMIADDDIRYTPANIAQVIETYKSHLDLDVATFKYHSPSSNKFYPDYSFYLKDEVKNYYVTSFEITFKRESIQGKIKFNELFGLGAPVLGAGEESVFIFDVLKAGLNCQYFPYVIAEHPGLTTTDRTASKPGVLMARGAYMSIRYPLAICIARAIAISLKLGKKHSMSFTHALRYTIKGIGYGRKHIKK